MYESEIRYSPARAERKRAKRESIIIIAAQHFLTLGYAGTTMSDIAASLGGSKATLWDHFESKVALFDAVLDYKTSQFRLQLSALL